MSCDSRRKNVVRRLLGESATPFAVAALEQGYKAACASKPDLENARDHLLKTTLMMHVCDRLGLPRPAHGVSGVPRLRSHRGYAYLFDSLTKRGVFSTPAPANARTVKGTDVPVWAMVEEACGCRAIRVPTPPKSPPYPYFLRLHAGTQSGCEHEERPIGWVGWCFDDGFTIVEEPPPRPETGPKIAQIPDGTYPALDPHLAEIRQIDDRVQRAYGVAVLSFELPSDQRQPFLCESLFHLGATEEAGLDVIERIATANIAIYFAEQGDLPNALFLVGMINDAYDRNDVLTRLVCKLPASDRGPYIDECLARASADYDGDVSRMNMLQTLVYDAKDSEQALKILATFEHPARQAEAFTACAKYLPDDALPAMITAARTIGSPEDDWDDRAEALASLVPRLAGHERDTVVEDVLELAAKRGHHYTRQKALAVAAVAMSPAQRRQALKILDSLIERPEDVTRDSRYAAARVAGYITMLPLLTPEERGPVRDEALRSAYQLPVRGDYDMLHQPNALRALLPYLEQPDRGAAVQAILPTVSLFRSDWNRRELLRALAPYLDDESRSAARAIAEQIPSDGDRLAVLDALNNPSSVLLDDDDDEAHDLVI